MSELRTHLRAGTRVRIADADGVPVDMIGTECTIVRRAGWPREAYWLAKNETTEDIFGPYYRGELDVMAGDR